MRSVVMTDAHASRMAHGVANSPSVSEVPVPALPFYGINYYDFVVWRFVKKNFLSIYKQHFFFLFLLDWCVGFRHIEALEDTVVFENKMNS